ncbi:unnamed protein product [Owenia fusiformis]|uniref:Uncharacterized protein n=1 Tax=Owenia fusiformis TaxID=6347 RepID=A0A8J1U6M4_OWEFU|nr:unnamed protein product [Owenia fusiformis]
MSTLRCLRIFSIAMLFALLNHLLKNKHDGDKMTWHVRHPNDIHAELTTSNEDLSEGINELDERNRRKGSVPSLKTNSQLFKTKSPNRRLQKRSTWYFRSEDCESTTAIIESSNQTCMDTVSASCENRCRTQPDSEFLCHCDDKCVVFKDCCRDFGKWCNVDVPKEKRKPEGYPMGNMSYTWNPSNMICFKATPSSWFYLVRKCPSHTEKNLAKRCEEENEAFNLLEAIPVSDMKSGVHYKNRFCAKCNKANPVDIYTWKVTIYCRNIGDQRQDEIPNEISLDTVMYLISRSSFRSKHTCELNYVFNATASIASPRPCFDVLSTCGDCADPTLIQLCKATFGMTPVYGYFSTKYRNIYCGMCHESHFNLKCGTHKIAPGRNLGTSQLEWFSLSILVNVNEDDVLQKDVYTTTIENEGIFNVGDVVYGCADDIASGSCSAIRCPVNFVASTQGTCVLASISVDIWIAVTTIHQNRDEADHEKDTLRRRIPRIIQKIFNKLIGTIKYLFDLDIRRKEDVLYFNIVHESWFKIMVEKESILNEIMLKNKNEFRHLLLGNVTVNITVDMTWDVKNPNDDIHATSDKDLSEGTREFGEKKQRKGSVPSLKTNSQIFYSNPLLIFAASTFSYVII